MNAKLAAGGSRCRVGGGYLRNWASEVAFARVVHCIRVVRVGRKWVESMEALEGGRDYFNH